MTPIDNESLTILEILLNDALREDVGMGDATGQSLPLDGVMARGEILAKAAGTLAGLVVLPSLRHLPAVDELGGHCEIELLRHDCEKVAARTAVARVRGDARLLLALERTILNWLSRTCGIATMTAAFVDAVRGTHAVICDTRKTAPGLRIADKYAVACGGGVNHRMGLDDEAMIKENHLALSGLSIGDAIAAIRENSPGLRITCEAESLAQAEAALRASADCVLLDELPLAEVRRAIDMRAQLGRGNVPFEYSGGVSLDNVLAIAQTGVERISIGALTHSAHALDLNLKYQRVSMPSGA